MRAASGDHCPGDAVSQDALHADSPPNCTADSSAGPSTPALRAARSIGDGDLKPLGLTAEPEVAHWVLGGDDTCLILGTDGLWDYLPNQSAADLVRDTVKDPSMCARRLVTEALNSGSGAHAHPSTIAGWAPHGGLTRRARGCSHMQP